MLLKYRTRMAEFGENFKAGRSNILCPLCELHPDGQHLILQCAYIQNEFASIGKLFMQPIDEVFTENISKELVTALKLATDIRNKKLNCQNNT